MVRNMLALDWFLGAALAGLIGGLLLGYQWGQPADASIANQYNTICSHCAGFLSHAPVL
jgi:hypothetical protein